MKKVFFLGAAALFSLALVVSSCSKDDDETCVTCTDDGVEYEYCYDADMPGDALASALEFYSNHPNAVCED